MRLIVSVHLAHVGQDSSDLLDCRGAFGLLHAGTCLPPQQLALAASAAALVTALVPMAASAGTVTTTNFSGCMVTNDLTGINAGLNKVSWQGMQAAAAAHSNITVKYLLSTTASDYSPNIDSFIARECGLIVTVGSTMAAATEAAAKANPSVHFAIVACTVKSGCLAKRYKNIISVKGTAAAVEAEVVTAAGD
jgi:basic membrane lipoprotein Med (substrate-binding protein (PBP1-ABC) superfamily)